MKVTWDPNKELFQTLVQRVKRVKSLNSGNRVVAVLWSQGERDIDVAKTPVNTYITKLKELITKFRTDTGSPNVPFLACGYSNDWLRGNALKSQYISEMTKMSCTDYTGELIRSATKRTGQFVFPNFGYVSINNVQTVRGDPVHYSFAGLRTLGERFWRVYNVIK
jgi:hypothetical protein